MSTTATVTEHVHAALLYPTIPSPPASTAVSGSLASFAYPRMQPTMEFSARQTPASEDEKYIITPTAAAGNIRTGYGSYGSVEVPPAGQYQQQHPNDVQKQPLMAQQPPSLPQETDSKDSSEAASSYQNIDQKPQPLVSGGAVSAEGSVPPTEVQNAWSQREPWWLFCVCLLVISMVCTIVAVSTPALYSNSSSSYGYFKSLGTQAVYVQAAQAFAIMAVLSIIVTFILLMSSIKMGGPRLLLVTALVQLFAFICNVISISVFIGKNAKIVTVGAISFGGGMQITAAVLDLLLVVIFFTFGSDGGWCQGRLMSSSLEGRRESHLPLELSPRSSLLAHDPLRCSKFTAWLSMLFMSLIAAISSLVGVAANALFSCQSTNFYSYYRTAYAGYFRVCLGYDISATTSDANCATWQSSYLNYYSSNLPTDAQQAGQGFAIIAVVLAFLHLLLVIIAAFARVRDLAILRAVGVVATAAATSQLLALTVFIPSTNSAACSYGFQLEYGGILQMVAFFFMTIVSTLGWVLSCKQMGVAVAVKQSCCRCS